MDSSEEMKKEISSPEDLETAKIEEGEIKDENTEAVTGGIGKGFPRIRHRSAPEQKPIA